MSDPGSLPVAGIQDPITTTVPAVPTGALTTDAADVVGPAIDAAAGLAPPSTDLPLSVQSPLVSAEANVALGTAQSSEVEALAGNTEMSESTASSGGATDANLTGSETSAPGARPTDPGEATTERAGLRGRAARSDPAASAPSPSEGQTSDGANLQADETAFADGGATAGSFEFSKPVGSEASFQDPAVQSDESNELTPWPQLGQNPPLLAALSSAELAFLLEQCGPHPAPGTPGCDRMLVPTPQPTAVPVEPGVEAAGAQFSPLPAPQNVVQAAVDAVTNILSSGLPLTGGPPDVPVVIFSLLVLFVVGLALRGIGRSRSPARQRRAETERSPESDRDSDNPESGLTTAA
jgi:hypothetical protein